MERFLEGSYNFFLWFIAPLGEVATFGVKALIVVLSFAICAKIFKDKKQSSKKHLKVKDLKKKYEKYKQQFYKKTLSKEEFKNQLKEIENQNLSFWKKLFHKKDKSKSVEKNLPNLFVLSFEGDIMASEVQNLREEISVIVNLAKSGDEVALLLNSRGGSVSHYGLAANQLQRLREHKIFLTVCVDKVAGSGGYLMACVGDKILASPFAMIGSIGVLAQIPNVHELLKKHDVSYEEITAGKFKRTLTPFSKITEEKKERLKEQLELIHIQFKSFIKQYRNIDLEEVATGEAWLAQEALKKSLVDKLQCSDDFILEKIKTHKVYQISLKKSASVLEKFMNKKSAHQVMEDFLHQDIII